MRIYAHLAVICMSLPKNESSPQVKKDKIGGTNERKRLQAVRLKADSE
jgi:hypothetical protein